MAGKRNGLGKGLDSLIPNKTVKEESASQQKVSKEESAACAECDQRVEQLGL